MKNPIVLILCMLLLVAGQHGANAYRIAIFGSSVANGGASDIDCPLNPDPPGSVACSYAEQLRQFHLARGNTVLNISVDGDTPESLFERFDRDLVPAEPDVVFIGVSCTDSCLLDHDFGEPICPSYIPEIEKLVSRMQKEGYLVVVGGSYPDERVEPYMPEAGRLRGINKATYSLKVPSVDLNTPVASSRGQWLPEFYGADSLPNGLGHLEMYHSFVPTVFDALVAGKPQPVRVSGEHSLRLFDHDNALISFEPEDVPMHSFTLSFRFKFNRKFYGEVHPLLSIEYAESNGFVNELELNNGTVRYVLEDADRVFLGPKDLDMYDWVTISITHNWAQRNTRMCVHDSAYVPYPRSSPASKSSDNRQGRKFCQVSIPERITPTSFKLGGKPRPDIEEPLLIDVQELLIYRVGVHPDDEFDVTRANWPLFHPSLEVYAPLDPRNPTENLAQSLSEISITTATE